VSGIPIAGDRLGSSDALDSERSEFDRVGSQALARLAALGQAKSAWEAVFNGFPYGLFIVDSAGLVTAVNSVQARRARDADRVIGWPCSTVFGDGLCQQCRLKETLSQGRTTTRIVSVQGEDRDRRWLEISCYPISGGAERSDCAAIVMVRDVTEQRRLESSFMRVEKLVALGRMASGIAHEINNPLAAIIANVELLRGVLEEGTLGYESLQIVARAAERAKRVAENLHSFAGEEQYFFKLVDVNATIRRALELVSSQFSHCPIRTTLRLAEGLPKVMASGEHLEIVWLNLALNAVESLRETDAIGRLVCTSEKLDSGWVRVTFWDNGLVVPAHRLSHLFDPFSSDGPEAGGMGLGLYNAHNIVKRHSGQLRVRADSGGGRLFEVLLPVASLEGVQSSLP